MEHAGMASAYNRHCGVGAFIMAQVSCRCLFLCLCALRLRGGNTSGRLWWRYPSLPLQSNGEARGTITDVLRSFPLLTIVLLWHVCLLPNCHNSSCAMDRILWQASMMLLFSWKFMMLRHTRNSLVISWWCDTPYHALHLFQLIEKLQGRATGLRDHGELIRVHAVPYSSLWRTSADVKVLAAVALYENALKDGLLVDEFPLSIEWA